MLEVVLDENIYVRALQAECSLDDADMQAARVVGSLQVNHVWVFSGQIVAAYHRQFSANRCRGALSSQLIKSLRATFADSRHFLFLDDPVEIEGPYHRKDRHVVAAAGARRGCYLVTIDVRLIAQLTAAQIPGIYEFSVVDLATAESVL